jgi:hypothetical protein
VAECTSPSGAIVTFAAMFSDNCPGVTDSCTPPSGSQFPLGRRHLVAPQPTRRQLRVPVTPLWL